MKLPIGRKLTDAEVAYYRSLTPAQKVQLTYELSYTLKNAVIVGNGRNTDDCPKSHEGNRQNPGK